MKRCLICRKPITSPFGTKFCSRKCNALNGSRISAGRRIPATPKLCLQCGDPYIRKDKRGNFCKQSCSAIYHNLKRGAVLRGKRSPCRCGEKLTGSQLKYCSRKCWRKYHSLSRLEKWKAGEWDGSIVGDVISTAVRSYILAKYKSRCTKCGWTGINPATGKTTVTIHHVDGNPRNNDEYNLTCLCPNCHSLTPTYGGLNKGNGRKGRRRSVHDRISAAS
jgi:hypothetical protein